MTLQKKDFLRRTERDEKLYERDLTQILDVLQRIGGSEDFVRSFQTVAYLIKPSPKEIEAAMKTKQGLVIFKSRQGSFAGHFHFRHAGGEQTDSYKEGWQTSGTNGFCQTFALMGALGKKSELDSFSKNKTRCSEAACIFLLENASKWHKQFWKKICQNIRYEDIKNLSAEEIKEDLLMSMKWKRKDGSSMFWHCVLEEIVYT